MKPQRIFMINMAIIIFMLSLSLWAWVQLPAGSLVPIRFNFAGQAVEHVGKSGLFLSPLIALLIAGVYRIMPIIEPLQNNIKRSNKAYAATAIAGSALIGALHILIVLSALDRAINTTAAIDLAMGLFLIVIGNYLGKTRRNYLLGLRTPWTLSSDLAWSRTHRLGGRLFVLNGLAFLLAAWTTSQTLSIVSVISLVVVSLIILPMYSFLVWRRDTERVSN